MPFLDSLDIANRACQHCGVEEIYSVTEDSRRNLEVSKVYDKVRRAELRRNVWRFSIRKTALRPIDTTTVQVVPSAYSAAKTYMQGEVVQDTNGLLWISSIAANINNQPGGNNDTWEPYFGPMTVSLWDADTSYFSGELVYVVTGTTPNGYQVYMSLISGNSDTPGTATAYDAAVQYKQDDVVSYSGSNWRSLLPINLNNTPAVGPSAYVASTTYSAAQQVTGSDNYIYTSIAGSNIGNDPTTDNGVHWTNTGALNAWTNSPALLTASINWRPITASVKNLVFIYPIGAGPSSQSSSRNVFRLPAGFLREAQQDQKGSTFTPLGASGARQADDWDFEGDFFTSGATGPVVFRFAADISKVSSMDDMFCEGLAARIATAVCSVLTQSDSKLQTIASAYKLFMGEARLVNGIEEGPSEAELDEYIAVRG